MKRIILSIISIVIFQSLFSQDYKYETVNLPLQSGDTIFLLNEIIFYIEENDTTIEKHSIYIEPNKQQAKKERKKLGDFRTKNNFHKWNKITYSSERNKHKKGIPKNLPTRWLPLYIYENNYYLYSPCQWVFPKYNITDTTFLSYNNFEGIFSYGYNNIIEKQENHFCIKNVEGYNNEYDIEIFIIDRQKGIAVFQLDYGKCLFVCAEKANQYPVIVHNCENLHLEYDFTKPDFNNLLRKFKRE